MAMRLTSLILVLLALPANGQVAPTNESVMKIYRQLARVSGEFRQPPALQVVPEVRSADGRRVAWYDPGARTIGIEAKTVHLCQSMGSRAEACVAFYLGHELAHFYKDHAWAADFGSRLSATPTSRIVGTPDEQQRLSFEAQADDVGLIYGYLAGYDTIAVAGDALSLVYRAYAIPPTATDYPSLADRQEIAKKAGVNLERFIPVFEAGNLLFILGRYQNAADCFDFIAQTFSSREILNDAGVALAMASESPETDWYPWLLDTRTRLRNPRNRAVGSIPESERKELLESARQRLTDSLRRDPKYIPALLNLSLVDDLLGRHRTAVDDAAAALDSATQLGEPETVGMARLALLIANFHAGSATELRGESTMDGTLASYWIAKASGRPVPARTAETAQKAGPDESITGLRARDIDLTKRSPLVIAHMQIRSRITSQTTELQVSTAGGRLRAIFTRDFAGATARELKVGTAAAAVEAAYGDPRLYGSGASLWYLYSRAGLIFRMSPESRVEGWILYSWQE